MFVRRVALTLVVVGFASLGSATARAKPVTPEPVPIEDVSNGCGGDGWKSVKAFQNYLGNTSVYKNSNKNPLAKSYTVDFTDACNLHDAGYGGEIVRDKIWGGVVDFRKWTRKQIDDKFLFDMRALCHEAIDADEAPVALKNCLGLGGNLSIGAESRYNTVRIVGDLFFIARKSGRPFFPVRPPGLSRPTMPRTTTTVPRTTTTVPRTTTTVPRTTTTVPRTTTTVPRTTTTVPPGGGNTGVTGIRFDSGNGFGSFIYVKITPPLFSILITCNWSGSSGSNATRTTITTGGIATCANSDVASWSDNIITFTATVTGTNLTTTRIYQ